MQLTRGRTVVAVVFLTSVLGLTGCSGPDLSSYKDVRATLNDEDGTLGMPLDDYALVGADGIAVEHANALLTEQCMDESGKDFPRAHQDWASKSGSPDRSFGLWSETLAETYGYDLPAQPGLEELEKTEAAMPDAWWTTYWNCSESTDLLPIMTPLSGDPASPSPVDRGITESVGYTQNDPVFKKAREDWSECIGKEGLEPQDGPLLLPKLPDDAESRSKIALDDVACKKQLGSMQIIADVMARYEAAYIDAHASELNEFRDTAREVLNEAQSIIATNGR